VSGYGVEVPIADGISREALIGVHGAQLGPSVMIVTGPLSFALAMPDAEADAVGPFRPSPEFVCSTTTITATATAITGTSTPAINIWCCQPCSVAGATVADTRVAAALGKAGPVQLHRIRADQTVPTTDPAAAGRSYRHLGLTPAQRNPSSLTRTSSDLDRLFQLM
jgi:hypothetical protein